MERKRATISRRVARLTGAGLHTLTKTLQARLSRAVASGRLTPEQAHRVEAVVQSRLQRIVTRRSPSG
ncbi:MAG: hypothetical protein HYY04_16990 [Chloroflexi bacterium]|nr:hypothetical protein [Chloroflexota bacterium]